MDCICVHAGLTTNHKPPVNLTVIYRLCVKRELLSLMSLDHDITECKEIDSPTMTSTQYLSYACESQIQATPNSSACLGLNDQEISYEYLHPDSDLIHVPAYGYPVLNRSPIFTAQPLFYHSPDPTYIKQLNDYCINPRISTPNIQRYSYIHGEEEVNVSHSLCAQPSVILDRELHYLPRDAYIKKTCICGYDI